MLCCDGAHHQKSPSPRERNMERESKLIVGEYTGEEELTGYSISLVLNLDFFSHFCEI
jgi:hypothetical protein